jgi:hypothetical protein
MLKGLKKQPGDYFSPHWYSYIKTLTRATHHREKINKKVPKFALPVVGFSTQVRKTPAYLFTY